MSSRTIHIAIISGDTLHILGLRRLIQEVKEDASVDVFSTIDEFRDSIIEEYHLVYIEDSILAVSGDVILRGKRSCVVPILAGPIPSHSESEQLYIHTRWDQSTIESAIADSLRSSHVVQASTADKGLSSREEEVLKEVARGLTNKEIADALNISMNTVMSHRKNITAKLNIKTVSGLTFYALMNNLISGEEVVERASD